MNVTTMCVQARRVAVSVMTAALMLLCVSGPASAQGNDPNPGALTFTGSYDFPTIYMFRGIRQETDPSLTMWPAADLKFDFTSGNGAVKGVSANIGIWNSLQTGSSGTGGPTDKLHYELDFYASFTLGFARSIAATTQYTAYTSPNGTFTNVKEILFKVASGTKYAPYGLIAWEIGGENSGQADAGTEKGTYVELGIGPSFPLGRTTLTVPVKVGLSASDYYELNGEDNSFGYFDIGGLITVPISRINSRFGSWNFHFGGDYYALGETTEAFNINKDGETSAHKVTGVVGFGVTY